MDKGRLVQNGNHEELLKEDFEQYVKLWNVQAQYYAKQGEIEKNVVPLNSESF